MIPKKIHYCWFGNNPLPEYSKKCIDSWKKNLPDYEIIEWNETNYDVHKIPYIAQAYDKKKYAFVSDYVRFDVLYENGGLYFDTDVEVIKNLDEICSKGNWLGIEDPGLINTGLGVGAEAGNLKIKEVLDSYASSSFINEDGSLNLKTVVDRVSEIFVADGFVCEDRTQKVSDFMIYSTEFFCPKHPITGILNITPNTCTIHHYDASWLDVWEKQVKLWKNDFFNKKGDSFINRKIALIYHAFAAIKNLGFYKGLIYILNKIK
ncbi:MAG: glycosyl transferase [Spirochaetia bacterium]|nr:glycosyl transferase [Spirochaetia bacterium]MDY5886627.1 glycosyltransferase [Treponema sp.]